MIIGLFIGLSVGVVAAALVYWLMLRRVRRLLSALQNNQHRLEQLASEHESRLRLATDQLRTDHERQMSDKIEHSQDAQMRQIELMELDFETRLNVIEAAYSRELETQIPAS